MTPNLHDATKEVVPHVIELRRHFHRNPETGLDLPLTAKRVEEELDALGIKHKRCIEHGVIGLLDSGQPGPTVMLRADMDALNIPEENTHEYVSTIPGKMHACGHDTHAAMLIGAANVLKRAGIQRGRLKLLFQPGEEGAHGAELMIADGALENPKVDYCYGQHIWAMTPVGTIQVEDGTIMAAVDTVYFTIEGKGTHAAQPDAGHDPIVCGAQIVSALQTIATRNVDPLQSCVITVSMFNAGTAHNIIPQRAKLAISVRVFDDAVHNLIERRIKEIITGISTSMGCTAEIDYLREHRPTVNAPEIAALVREEAVAIVGSESVWNHGQKTMGAEDMSDFLHLAPGAFAFVGGYNEAKGCNFPHHHPRFNIDEDGLALGTELMYRVGQRLLTL